MMVKNNMKKLFEDVGIKDIIELPSPMCFGVKDGKAAFLFVIDGKPHACIILPDKNGKIPILWSAGKEYSLQERIQDIKDEIGL